jgi:hypothetical protein
MLHVFEHMPSSIQATRPSSLLLYAAVFVSSEKYIGPKIGGRIASVGFSISTYKKIVGCGHKAVYHLKFMMLCQPNEAVCR